MKQAACQDIDREVFFPVAKGRDNDHVKRAKAICETCPVISECFWYAINERLTYGIFGGKTGGQREEFYRIWRRREELGLTLGGVHY